MAVAHIQVLCFKIIVLFITSNVHTFEDTEYKVPPASIRTSAFLPQSKAELESAVDACLALSPKGDCFDGPHGSIGEWDVSHITNLSSVFAYLHSFNANICEWDVSSVTTMNRMFLAATTFTGDISKWDVSRVTDMDGMFWDAINFDGDILNWNVSSVTSMSHMFAHTTFNGDISKWDVSRVTDIQSMFSGNSAFNGDISKWDVSRVINMNLTFKNAKSFNVDLSQWNISRVANIDFMFAGTLSFNHKLCGSTCITTNANKSRRFLDSLGSISSTTHRITTTPFSPRSRTEIKGVVDACLSPRPLPRIIAHRGGSRIGPENTKGALLNALRLDVDGTEFDIQLTGDGQLVLLHDDTLERTAVPYSRARESLPDTMDEAEYRRILTTNVRELSYEDIGNIDVSAPIQGWHQPEHIITFAEALQHVKAAPDKFCFAELKKCVTSEERVLTAELAAQVIKESNITPKQLVIISFGLDILIHMKKLLPSFQCLHIIYPFRAMSKAKAALDAGMDGVDFLALPKYVTKEVIDYVHSRGKRVVVWIWRQTRFKSLFFPPTDTVKNVRVLTERGVDDFTTDLPPDVLAVVT